jgi:hypothetical protein
LESCDQAIPIAQFGASAYRLKSSATSSLTRPQASFQLIDFRGSACKELGRFSLDKIFSDFV